MEEENHLDENYNKTNEKFFDTTKEKNISYDNEFIKTNFYPLKFSKIDIKNLSSDFTDQTLGGHRKYREEIIDGRLAKVYIYKVKIIKYDDEYLSVERKSTGEATTPLIIIENNLIVPCSSALAQNRRIPFTSELPSFPMEGENLHKFKRGRPRKYPPGEEPYKKRRTFENYYEIVPKQIHKVINHDKIENPFSFESFERRSTTPPSNEYLDFSKVESHNKYDGKKNNLFDDREMSKFDEYLKKLSPKMKDDEEESRNIFKLGDYLK